MRSLLSWVRLPLFAVAVLSSLAVALLAFFGLPYSPLSSANGNPYVLTGAIQGLKFDDIDGDGIKDPGEPGLPGVSICISGVGCTLTNSNGNYSFGNLSPTTYTVFEQLPTNRVNTTPIFRSATVTAGQTVTGVDFGNRAVAPPPPDVSVTSSPWVTTNGTPAQSPNTNLVIQKTITTCSLGVIVAKATVTWPDGTVRTGNMTNISGNLWNISFSAPFPSGAATLRIDVDCAPDTAGYPENPANISGEDVVQIGNIVFMDPSGAILNGCSGAALQGATVTLLKESPVGSGIFVVPSNLDHIPATNPQTTGADGAYAWVVVPGTYRVQAAKAGFVTGTSPSVTIPPAVTGLDISLLPTAGSCTFTVTKTDDTSGTCAIGNCSLREAIAAANAVAGVDTIIVPAGTYTLTLGSELTVNSDLTLTGAGAGSTIIQAGSAQGLASWRVFNITSGNVGFSGLRVQHGNTGGFGGGINNSTSGTLTLVDTSVVSNWAPANGGAGIFNAGTLTATSSQISGNSGFFHPGGIYNDGTVTLTNSNVGGNSGGGIFNSGTLTATNSQIGGNGGGGFGGVNNTGTLTLTNSTVGGNGGDGGGGGINNGGTLTVSNSTFHGNGSCGNGGGINNIGTLTVTNSTFSGNHSDCTGGSGGGIYNGGALTVTNSTFSGNFGTNFASTGGGIANSTLGTVTMINTTVTGNSAPQGGGIHIIGTLSSKNSIVANNPSGGNCSGGISSLGHNLDSDNTCGLTDPTDLPNTNPLLGPLANNGGPTLTHALQPASPAIDAVPIANCTDINDNPLTIDQRGVARPQGAACDIGAYEFVPPANQPPTANAGGPYSVPEGGSANLNGSGSDPDNDPLTYTWDLNGDGTFETSGQNVTFSAAGLDGPTIKTVALKVCDDDNACATSQGTVNITNVAPSVIAGADLTNFSGQTHLLTAAYTDPAIPDTHTATINWGDGSPVQNLGAVSGGTLSASHQYFAPGDYTITVTVADDDGGIGSDSLVKTVQHLPVQIDIKPGSFPNSINLKSKGNVPVGVFSETYQGVALDATTIVLSSVVFAGAPALSIGQSPQDLDEDGDLDQVFHFSTQALNLTQSSTQGCLTGQITGNIFFQGCDSVRVVPP